MKTSLPILIVSLLFFSTNFNAQLTNAEVYDFEVGDVFHTRLIHNNSDIYGSIKFHWDTIVDKTTSANFDSITYIIKRTKKTTFYGPGGFSTDYSTNLVSSIITDLNDLAAHYWHSYSPGDTVLTAYNLQGMCNNLMDYRYTHDLDGISFEPIIWESFIYKGLGGPFYKKVDYGVLSTGSASLEYDYGLIYFNTQGNGSCGIPISLANIKENSLSEIKIYPNPVQNNLIFKTDLSEYSYRIISLSGKEFQSDSKQQSGQINLTLLPKGIYFLELKTDTKIVRKRFVKL